MNAQFTQHKLIFKQASGTSRGVLTTKETYLLEISEGDKKGIGECAIFRGLSYDDVPDYEEKLTWLCKNINLDFEILKKELLHYPSIIFGLEQALLNLQNGEDLYFPSDFTDGKDSIKINGLIWMGNADFMQSQIEEKLAKGFDCIKLKIGVDWKSEKEIIKKLREKFPKEQLELRVDANGAFNSNEALSKLNQLNEFELHSIEQPIKANQLQEMKLLCEQTPFPIALDEELIGVFGIENKRKLLEEIQPQYIILKPSLVGGFKGTLEWISIAESLNIGWWITSALESNIGLNAITQFTYILNNPMPQGLGTGGLYTNNFDCPLEIENGHIQYNVQKHWDFSNLGISL